MRKICSDNRDQLSLQSTRCRLRFALANFWPWRHFGRIIMRRLELRFAWGLEILLCFWCKRARTILLICEPR